MVFYSVHTNKEIYTMIADSFGIILRATCNKHQMPLINHLGYVYLTKERFKLTVCSLVWLGLKFRFLREWF